MKNDPRICERNLRNCDIGGCSSQLTYEATDVANWSILCSYVPVKEMNVADVYERNHI